MKAQVCPPRKHLLKGLLPRPHCFYKVVAPCPHQILPSAIGSIYRTFFPQFAEQVRELSGTQHLHAVLEGLLSVVRPGVQAVLTRLLGQQGRHQHGGKRFGGWQVDVSHIVVGPTSFADAPAQALLQ